MCHWRFEVHLSDDWDDEVAAFPFAGGRRPVEEARALVLGRVRRQVAGYVNAHPDARQDIRIVEMSCNGPQRTIYPYRQGSQGGELRIDIGGWEFLPGTEEKLPLADLPAAPDAVASGPASRPSGLSEREATGEPDPRLFQGLAPLTGDADIKPVRVTALGREPEDKKDLIRADAEFIKPERDGWESVRDHFDSFLHYPREQAETLERLRTWARIASQGIEGGGRANDEQVEVRSSTLYSLRHALRELEATEGKLLVGRDDAWAPYATQVVAMLAEAKVEVEQLEMQGYQPAVYTIERGQAGTRLYPVSDTPYTVWSMGTANLIAEFETADEAIACAKDDPDDLVAFLEENGQATVVYDPNGLVPMSVADRRERLRGLGRWPVPTSPADRTHDAHPDAEEER